MTDVTTELEPLEPTPKPFTLDDVHKRIRLPDSSEWRLVETNFLARVSFEGDNLYLQNGRVFGEGGDVVPTLPTWAIAAIGAMTPSAREVVGFPAVWPPK